MRQHRASLHYLYYFQVKQLQKIMPFYLQFMLSTDLCFEIYFRSIEMSRKYPFLKAISNVNYFRLESFYKTIYIFSGNIDRVMPIAGFCMHLLAINLWRDKYKCGK